FIIDTTGAAALVARYATDVASRRLPFYRGMRYPGFTVVNNRLLLDAVFIRDYHGDDSTVFANGSNKNGDSPADWSCPVSQGVPDKNDILDMMVHVRRAGPSTTDSLWMFGGLSLDNTTGNRYFDFEMYQTDIYYDRPSRKFYGYGPDAGHTTWQFDAAGNITVPGDISFNAEYQSSALSNVEARIWINRASLSITPTAFNWTGQFDGASSGATYGYAVIQPKAAGTYYTGLQCGNGTWGGPFSIILQGETVATDYVAKQFVEFSVNLTKLGLDPVTLLGSNSCGMPFRRILVKTRASASFTAELKDFVGPFDFFLAPRVKALSEAPFICGGSGVSKIDVVSPVATSVYQWTTPNGNIISSTTATTIYVDQPGTYIVTQSLQAGCSTYATDTVKISPFSPCSVLPVNALLDFRGTLSDNSITLSWKVEDNQQAQFFEVQRSFDGSKFTTIGQVNKQASKMLSSWYLFQQDDDNDNNGKVVYYRIMLVNANNSRNYSNTIRFSLADTKKNKVVIFPNPVKNVTQLQVSAISNSSMRIELFESSGQRVFSQTTLLQRGNNVFSLDGFNRRKNGVYVAVIHIGEEMFTQKIMLAR
ncbi:MAG: T9SS type A sorting domain-containing protein, partial [Bacteroidota bacterium]|nr:T9SS type A sorting domain-containing protein [Bacteroidota bacterium]